MIACSTTWNIKRRGSYFDAASELMAMGFEAVELRSRDGVADAASCAPRMKSARVRVASVHAPMLVTGDGSTWMDGLASADDAARRRAVETLVASARHAKAVGTGLVVVHAGSVAMPDAAARFRSWREQAEREGRIADEILEEAATLREQRTRLRDGAMEALLRSLHAAGRAEPDVTFSLETRLHLHELPAIDELEILFAESGVRNLGYTHDTGHAAVQQALGGPDQRAWLDRYGERCVSAHLHDVLLLHDHLPPGAGTVDWDAVRAQLPSSALRVLEVHRDHPKQMLLEGLTFLQSRGFEAAVV